MKWFLDIGNRYAKQSDWTDFALVKLCLASIGILIGLFLPQRMKKGAVLCAGMVFLMTYIPLIIRLIGIIRSKK